MAKKSVLPRLNDIFTAIGHIEDAQDGQTFALFKGEAILQAAIERFVERISEASRHIPQDLLDAYPHIPWPDVRAIGNILRHEYHRVAPEVIWKTATTAVPQLKPVITAMIATMPVASKPKPKKQT